MSRRVTVARWTREGKRGNGMEGGQPEEKRQRVDGRREAKRGK